LARFPEVFKLDFSILFVEAYQTLFHKATSSEKLQMVEAFFYYICEAKKVFAKEHYQTCTNSAGGIFFSCPFPLGHVYASLVFISSC
jgi:hypothetical protein